jgi:hypothetical protein
MVKYGKEFRKNQITNWKEKYFNYKEYKQKIKSLIKEKKKEDFLSKNENEKEKQLEIWSTQFTDALDKDIKKVYIFFANREKDLYKKINKYLHIKVNIENFGLYDYLNVYKELNELSLLSLNMSNYIYYNLKAIIKILKKFDKKIIGPEFKKLHIRINYINVKLEEQNSDILYLLKFKMIDEINLLLEDLIKKLKEQFELDKNELKKINIENDLENKLIDEATEINQAESLIRKNHDTIIKNIKKIDTISAKITELFFPWKNFLRISSDMNSKLIQLSKRRSALNESTASIVDTFKFSKDNIYNIFIVLFHSFLYMLSYSIIIPFYTSIFDEIKKIEGNKYIYWGILMMMAPFGALFNYLYETIFFKQSTKIPLIISSLGLMIGNLLYSFAPIFKYFSLLFIGRFLIGLFNLRTHNKMYIMNFLLKKDVSFYLTMFHTFSMVGLGSGFLVNCILFFIELEHKIVNKFTLGTLFASVLSFILLVLTIALFTEAYSKHFNISSLQMFGDGIINDNDNENEENLPINSINDNNNNTEGMLKKQNSMLKTINDQLGDFNNQNKFDDTNLVFRSILELTNQETDSLHFLYKSFITYLFIIFTTKFINESIYINTFIFNKETEIIEKDNKDKWIITIALGSCSFLSLLVELSLSCKHLFISEKKLLMILLALLLIINGFMVAFHF